MKHIALLFCLTLLVLIGCAKEKDNENSQPQAISHALDGEWHLISVTCECEGLFLEPGTHVWDVNVDEANLNVNNTTGSTDYALPLSGDFTLEITADSLFYGETPGYKYSIVEDDLYLEQMPEVDGPLIHFIR